MKKIPVAFITVFIFQLLLFPLTSFAQSLIANDFVKSTSVGKTLVFSANDFISHSNPPTGKSLVSVRFNQVTNPTAGKLKLNGKSVKKGTTASVSELNGLYFEPSDHYEGDAIFTWTASYGDTQSPYPGAVVITVGSGYKAPSVISDEEKDEQTSRENDAAKENYDNDSPSNASAELNTKQAQQSQADNRISEKSETESSTQQSELKPLRYEDMLSHWGAYSAGMLASRGYIIGDDFGNSFYFKPDEVINRFEFVLMVNAVFGIKPKDITADNPFSDKNVPSYVMRVGIAAYEYDIISGSKGKDGLLYFNPYDTITRAEAIAIVDCALKLNSYGADKTDFADMKKIPDWAMQSVKNLEAYGIIQGYEDNTIRPLNKITRAQAAEMVWQALKFLDAKRTSNAVCTTVIYGD